MEILLNIGIAILGILLFTIFKAKDFILTNEFNLVIFLTENFKSWVLSIIIITTIAVVIYFVPDANQTIKSLILLDLDNTPKGFFFLGIGINEIFKKPSTRAKIVRTRRKVKNTITS